MENSEEMKEHDVYEVCLTRDELQDEIDTVNTIVHREIAQAKCMCVCCTCTVRMYVCMYIMYVHNLYVCTYTLSVYVSMYICIHVCMVDAWMYICMCIYIYTVCICTWCEQAYTPQCTHTVFSHTYVHRPANSALPQAEA